MSETWRSINEVCNLVKEGFEMNMNLRYKRGRPITSLITKVIIKLLFKIVGLPQWLRGKESTCNAGDPGPIPESGRSPGEGNGNPLQYSCLRNPMDRGSWWATVHGVTRVGHYLARKPMISDVEHHFMCLLATCVSSLEKYPFHILCSFFLLDCLIVCHRVV